ncbi:MAG: TrbI/VirB10 family protein [Mesorhizobium sp.]|uniref:type IV secretion system protein VirB10 n=1 Tax=Mesorhizobium sp. TaxID=1871066 RepID=UPI000FEA19FC|nr:type IV secretion system protein VirB10 [Mesorhizobium sp.]RWO94217.1 MAG: TrbI/VirB10 family protein [Mesorhizobium sp.]
MSNIDYHELDGGSAVARRNAGLGTKLGIAGIGLMLAGGLLYINWPSGPSDRNTTSNEDEAFETSTFQPNEPATPATELPPQDQIVIPPPQTPPPEQSADVDQTVATGVDLEEQRRLLEQQMREAEARRLAEEERKRKEQEEKELWERLRSNQIVIDGEEKEPAGEAAPAIAGDGQLVPVPGADLDPNKAFLAQAEVSRNANATATKNNRTDALIAEGTMIRGFLETAINTDLPGMVRAVVREDVYSLDGRRVLIPKGSRLTGEYKSGIARGQTRVFIVWNRMIRSDGVSVNIGSPGADSLGRGGMAGRVDRHWLERFGSAIVLSIVGGAAEYLSALADPSGGRRQETITRVDPVTGEVTTITIDPERTEEEARQIAIERSASTMTELAKEAFEDSRNIPPTIYVDQGTSVIVFVRRDLDFSELYADPVQEELARLKRGGRPRVALDPVPLYTTPKDNWFPAAPPVTK